MVHGVRRVPRGRPRSGRCQLIPACSRPTKSIEVSWIRTEISADSAHGSDQPSPLRTFVSGDYIVLGRKLPLDGSAHQVRLTRTADRGSLLQPSAQVSGKPHCDSIVFHLSNILADLSDIRECSRLVLPSPSLV